MGFFYFVVVVIFHSVINDFTSGVPQECLVIFGTVVDSLIVRG